jgi:hypothetical protein
MPSDMPDQGSSRLPPINPLVSKHPFDHDLLANKRKRTPTCPFATRTMCEQAINLLAKDELVRELGPPDEWLIYTSMEATCKGFQQERRLWVKNDLKSWHVAKIRQHAYDSTRIARRSRFEEGFVSSLNSSFVKLLRRFIRGGGGRHRRGGQMLQKRRG